MKKIIMISLLIGMLPHVIYGTSFFRFFQQDNKTDISNITLTPSVPDKLFSKSPITATALFVGSLYAAYKIEPWTRHHSLGSSILITCTSLLTYYNCRNFFSRNINTRYINAQNKLEELQENPTIKLIFNNSFLPGASATIESGRIFMVGRRELGIKTEKRSLSNEGQLKNSLPTMKNNPQRALKKIIKQTYNHLTHIEGILEESNENLYWQEYGQELLKGYVIPLSTKIKYVPLTNFLTSLADTNLKAGEERRRQVIDNVNFLKKKLTQTYNSLS